MDKDIFAQAFADANGLTIETESVIDKANNDATAQNDPAGTNPANASAGQNSQNNAQANQQNNQQSSQADPGAGQAQSNTVTPSFEELLATNSKGRFKKLEDIDAAITESVNSIFASEKVAKLNEYMKSGGKFEDFARTQLTDYTKLDDISKIKERMRITDSYLTDEEIDIMIESEYSVPEEASERDKKLVEIKRKRDAKEAESILIENQKKWAVTDRSSEEIRAEAEQKFGQWKNAFHGSVDKTEKLEFQIGEKENAVTFNFEVPKDVRNAVKDKYTMLDNFWQRYSNEDGTENIEKLVKDLYVLENLDAIIKSATGFAKTLGREEVIAERKQPGYTAPSQNQNNGGVKSIEEQIAENAPR